MLQVRYGGCSGCLSNASALLNKAGYRKYKDYDVRYHDEFRKEELYKNRPDLLKKFTGAIIINPDTGKFINLYPDGKVLKYSQSFLHALKEIDAPKSI